MPNGRFLLLRMPWDAQRSRVRRMYEGALEGKLLRKETLLRENGQ